MASWKKVLTGSSSIKDLSDVYDSMSPSDGQVLTYDTTNGWQAETPSTGAIDVSGTPANNQLAVWVDADTLLHFAENVHVIKDNLMSFPPLFQLIKEQSQTEWREMFQVFNMGHRLEIYTDQSSAEQMIQIAAQFNIRAQIIGYTESSENKKLSIKGDWGTEIYE